MRRRTFIILAAFTMAAPLQLRAQTLATADSLTTLSTRVETTLPGTPTAIYDAITGDITAWWDHGFLEGPTRKLVLDPRPGGHFLETIDDSGDGVLHATVIRSKRGELLQFDGPLGFMGQAVQSVTTYRFEAVGADSTRLIVEANAAGTLDAGERAALAGVWRHFILNRFKPFIEQRHAQSR